ncbi:hypothetical protein [Dethiobacter alkaliphilus]|uniref:ATP-binding protein n=1 Tax=Dethiobacter alkaliphilus AHT 1 TaxID=555088 RepID=C0GD36_DETAL|nr:hypothetical protein [Dethiobacter alkaliphilus]EEG79121.1 conserved hypothetical protein [Dethiobacter alkaliphilus AHT 1]
MTNINNSAVKNMERPKRFFRSIRLDSDINDINNLSGYSLTNHVLYVLGRIEEGVNDHAKERAFTLTGPYGSGKSAFALFLCHLLNNKSYDGSNIAFDLLKNQDLRLSENYANTLDGNGLYPVVLTLRRAPLSYSILEGLVFALHKVRQSKSVRNLIVEIKNDLSHANLSGEIIKARIAAFIDVLPKHYKGMVLVLDELGKALEYAARYTGEDVYLLQELAEFASRSGDKPFLLFGILHQSFEQYGEYLDHAARQEWAKIQGRFCDIAFIEPPEQQIRLAVQAISSLEIDIHADEKERASSVSRKLIEKGYIPSGLKPREVQDIASSSYPLHLTVLFALPHLFKRFAQNERSLFAYLLSKETFGLQEQLAKSSGDFIRLPNLFDYFHANISNNITKQAYSRRWIEVADALERTPDLTSEEVSVLKTIGLLGILGEISFMSATREFISIALSDEIQDKTIEECLASLQKRSLIVFRRYNNTYKIWEGSDVDIEARLEDGRRNTQGLLLADDLQKFLPKRPLVARRHSHEKGAMRYFELRYIDSMVQAKHLLPSEGIDGVIVCCLPSMRDQIDTFVNWVKNEEICQLKNVLIVVPQQIGTLRDAASELRAIHWVWQNTPELRDDRIARRELAERNTLIEQMLTQAVQHILDPRPEPNGSNAAWYYMGEIEKVESLRGISELLSRVMDKVYSDSPTIKNELINRRGISAAAAAARRNLVERMLSNENELLLGMEGYPPERSIYESVLKASGIHQPGDQCWNLPSANDSLNLYPAFKRMEELVFSSLDEPYSIEKLLKDLSGPPIGVMPGVFPVLLVAFMLSFPDEISLYREGVFIPEPNIADFEVLMRRPELYAVAGSRLEGERMLVVQRIANSLRVRPTTLSVARALIGMLKSLPDHAWRTRKLPGEVLKLRTAIEQARSPEKLLFVDIPEAVGEEPFTDQPVDSNEHIIRFFNKLNEAITSWREVTDTHIAKASKELLAACNMPEGVEGWKALIQTAHDLKSKPVSDKLNPLITRLTTPNEINAVVESVLAQIANRPPRSWTDKEVDDFPELAKQIGNELITFTQKYAVLTDDEEAACEKLIDQLKTNLREDSSPQIIRVALSRLLQEY